MSIKIRIEERNNPGRVLREATLYDVMENVPKWELTSRLTVGLPAGEYMAICHTSDAPAEEKAESAKIVVTVSGSHRTVSFSH